MNPFDQGSRYLAKRDPPGFLRWLLPGLGASVSVDHWRDTRSLAFPGEGDRTGDTVAALTDSLDPALWWALAVEFQIDPDAEMFGRLPEFLGRLWRERRPPAGGRYHVGAAVINLTGSRPTASRDLHLAGTVVRTQLQVAERNLATEDALATLTALAAGYVAPCVLPFIPLMHGGAEAATIALWKAMAEAESAERLRGDYGGLALVFAEAARIRDVWKDALKGWNMR